MREIIYEPIDSEVALDILVSTRWKTAYWDDKRSLLMKIIYDKYELRNLKLWGDNVEAKYILELQREFKMKRPPLTPASLTFNVLKRAGFLHKYNLHSKRNEWLRRAYFGGKVLVYRDYLKKGYFYDVNAFYPFIILNFDMPIGKGFYIRQWDPRIWKRYNYPITFVEAEVDIKSEWLPSRSENGEIEWKERGKIIGVWDWDLLRIGREYEAFEVVNFGEAMIFRRGQLPFEFLYDFYERRKEADFWKVAMNAAYGIWASNPIKTVLSMELPEKIEGVKLLKDPPDPIWIWQIRKHPYPQNYAIAARITSIAILIMNILRYQHMREIAYIDTDSLHSERHLNLKVSDDIGKWKVQEAVEIRYLGKKWYEYVDPLTGEIIKVGRPWITPFELFSQINKIAS